MGDTANQSVDASVQASTAAAGNVGDNPNPAPVNNPVAMGSPQPTLSPAPMANVQTRDFATRANPSLSTPAAAPGSWGAKLADAFGQLPKPNLNVPGEWSKYMLAGTHVALDSYQPKPGTSVPGQLGSQPVNPALVNPNGGSPNGGAPAPTVPAPPNANKMNTQGPPTDATRQAGWDQLDAEQKKLGAAQKLSSQNPADLAIGAMNGAMKNFGDFASGVGAKGGVAGAMLKGFESHGKRMEEEAKDHQQIATANAQLLHEQALTHSLEAEQAAKSEALGKQGVDMFTDPSVPNPGVKVGEDLTAGELAKEVKDNHIQPWQDSIFHTGNRDGVPTYSAVRLPMGNINLNAAQAKKLNDSLGTNFQDGQPMKMSQLNQYWQDATQMETRVASARYSAAKAGVDADEMESKLRESKYATDSLVTQAVSAAAKRGELFPEVAAYVDLLKNQEFLDSHPGFRKDYPKSLGEEAFSKMEIASANNITKTAAAAQKRWATYDKDDAFSSLDKATASAARLQEILNDNENPLMGEDRKHAVSLLRQAETAVKALQTIDTWKENEKQAAKSGDPRELGKMLYYNQLAPEQLSRVMRSNAKGYADSLAYAQKLAAADGKVYNPTDADAYFKTATSTPLVQQFGNANSLIAKGGTIDQVIARHQALQPGKYPVFNNYKELADYQTGDSELAAYRASVIGMADDFAKVMGGGAGSDSARDSMIQVFSYAMNQGQLEAASDAAHKAVESQVKEKVGTNPFLMRMYGYALPEWKKATADQREAMMRGAAGEEAKNAGTVQPNTHAVAAPKLGQFELNVPGHGIVDFHNQAAYDGAKKDLGL